MAPYRHGTSNRTYKADPLLGTGRRMRPEERIDGLLESQERNQQPDDAVWDGTELACPHLRTHNHAPAHMVTPRCPCTVHGASASAP